MNIIPLSNAQQRIWLEWQLNSNSVAYNNPLLYELDGALNVTCLTNALELIVKEQPALRSYFMTQAGFPCQILETEYRAPVLKFHDVTTYSPKEQQQIVQRIIDDNVLRPFNLAELPLFRFSLIKTDRTRFILVLNIHHIVVDGYSAQLLIQNISDYYTQFLTADTVEPSPHDALYSDYLKRSQNNDQDNEAAKTFWQHQFNDANIRIDLLQNELSGEQSDEGIRHYFSITPELTQQLKQLAKQYKTTDFIILMAAFYVVLAKYANQDDLTIGYPLDVRPVDCRHLFGFFVNNIPLRVRLDLTQNMQTLVQQLNKTRKDLKPHQKTDLKDIIRYVRALYPSHPDSLYNVSFIRANFARSGLELPDIKVTPQLISTQAVKDDLCLLFDEHQGEKFFEFALEYKKQNFQADYIQHLQDAYLRCLQAIVQEIDIPINALSLFRQVPRPIYGEQQPLTEDFIERFCRHAQLAPEQLALITSTESKTYGELHAEVLAWRRQHASLAENNKPILVCLERNAQLVVILLALQSMRITYIPVDPNIPIDRLLTIIEDSGARTCIYDNPRLNELPCQLISTHHSSYEYEHLDFATPDEACGKDNNIPAYIIYTSGSTGKPKGVAVGRLALNNFLQSMAQHFMNEVDSVMLAITTVSFDIAGLELFLPLWQQKTLVLADQAQHKDPFMIKNLLQQFPITHLQATPAMWHMLTETGWTSKNKLIALCGGEALSSTLANTLLDKVGQLWNMYGPTEATIWCALKQISKNTSITVGKPIHNMEMRVVDSSMTVLPTYVKGELYIGGIGLADGYVNQPELTQAQFIEVNNQRLYRAGDIACTNQEGEFILFGRTDNQIKLNGYRIELGEIESRIEAIPEVQESAVIVHQNQLIAYLTLKSEQQLSEYDLFIQLERTLPEYMLPKRCVFLDKFPLTTSGKLDRKSLPTDGLSSSLSSEKPACELEQQVQQIWQSILKKTNPGVTDHFYSLGGHSLTVSQLTSQINETFGIELKLIDLLNHPTIRTQCQLIRAAAPKNSLTIEESDALCARLSSTQHRLWFMSQFEQTGSQFHMAAQLEITGTLDVPRLEQALITLSQRHDALKTVIELINHEPFQRVDASLSVPLLRLPVIVKEWVLEPFDMSKPLWRAGLYQHHKQHWSLVFCLHHIIADGYSVPLFLSELWQLYTGTTALPPINGRYIDYINAQNNKTDAPQAIKFWQEELFACPYLNLPYELINEHNKSKETHVQAPLLAEQWAQIRRFCEQKQVSINSFFTGVFALFLQHYAQQDDFCIGLPVANREHEAARDKIACFMDLMPLRLKINRQFTFTEWIKHINEQIITCLSHQPMSFSSILHHIHIEREGIKAPLFPVVFNCQPDPFKERCIEELTITTTPIYSNSSKYELSLELYFTEEKGYWSWEYDNNLFTKDTVIAMMEQLTAFIKKGLDSPNYPILQKKQSSPVAIVHNSRPAYVKPETTLQQKVALIWEQVLGVSPIGLADHFFSLGGHSFLAAKMISMLTEELGCAIPLESVFRNSNLADFCAKINTYTKPVSPLVFEKTDCLPLTPNQRQMALLLKEQDSGSLHISALLSCPADIDLKRLESSLNTVIRQHSIYAFHLNTATQARYATEFFVPIQEIEAADPHAAAMQMNAIPFNMYAAPLLRVCAIKSTHYSLLVTIHHLIGDEWSLHQLMQSVLNHYYNKKLPPSSQWECYLSLWTKPQKAAELYWQNYLKNTQQSHIPETHVNTVETEACDARQLIPVATIKACELLASQHNATLYHILLAVFTYFIRQISHEEQVTFAVTYHRRQTKELQDLQGYLVNLLPLSCPVDAMNEFSTLVQWIKDNHLHTMEHNDVDYAMLMEQGLVTSPEIVFNYQQEHQLFDGQQRVIKWQEICTQQARFAMTFHLRKQHDGSAQIILEYKKSLYHPDFVSSLLSLYCHLLQERANHPQRAQSDWYENLHGAIPHQSYAGECGLIPHLMHSPNTSAVYYDKTTISYATLWHEVNQLAGALCARYEQNNTVIGVELEHRYHHLVSMLAILQSGATYLPIDIHLPDERKAYLLDDSQAGFVIDKDLYHELSSSVDYKKPPTRLAPDSLAYIIYTSGTTGQPKGAGIRHESLHRFIKALQERLQLDSADRVLQFSSVSFDASIWEMFLSLYSGATLVIPTEKERRVGSALQEFMASQNITHSILTPAVLNTLNPALLPSLRSVVSGGEACTPSLVSLWSKYCRFYNAYGPTEATVCVTLGQLTPETKANNIGTVLGDARLCIVSPTLQIVPPGVIGELLIGGPILAKEYINNKSLTEERFVVINHQRWYRTGDKARQIHAQQFEYIGRQDRQIKLRGLRIELGEIEASLCALASVRSAYCEVNEEQILAYITAEKPVDTHELLKKLAKNIPYYLLPAQIIQLNEFPLLPSGKINPKLLQRPVLPATKRRKPGNELEEKIHMLWCEHLHRTDIDIDTDFFILGGNSLQAMSIASSLEEEFSVTSSIHLFYSHGTIAKQSAWIEEQNAKDDFDLLLSQLSESEQHELLKELKLL